MIADSNNAPNREIISFNDNSVVVEWLDGNTINNAAADNNDGSSSSKSNWIVLATYPEVATRKLSRLDPLLTSLITRYELFFDHHCNQLKQQQQGEEDSSAVWQGSYNKQLFIPPSNEFDTAFTSILRRFQEQLSSTSSAAPNNASSDNKKHKKHPQSTNTNTSKKGGKQATTWHDGNQKVTKAALAELDMSKDKDNNNNSDENNDGIIREDARAIAEAKAAYMPSNDEVPAWEEEDEYLDEININWDEKQQGDEEMKSRAINE